MSEPLSKIPSGMRYYFGQEACLRRSIEATAMSTFQGWSYEEISTPTVDYYSLFEHGMGAEAHRAFRFTDTDGRLLALRPDVTSATARAAVTLFAERERPLRFCYAAPVFRQKPQSHAEWKRESTQIGCELIGTNSNVADLEVLAIVTELLGRLDLESHYSITLNDAGIFNGIAGALALDAAARDRMRQLINVRNATDLEAFLAPYDSTDEASVFAQIGRLSGKRETLSWARQLIRNEQSRAALDRIEALWDVIESLGLKSAFEIDLGDVSRLDYYTGLTFKVYVEGAGTRVGSGGRYDGLTESFGKVEPAVGFVMDLDALTDVLRFRGADVFETGEPVAEDCERTTRDPAALLRNAMDRRAEGKRVVLDLAG